MRRHAEQGSSFVCQMFPKDGYPHQPHAWCWCQPLLTSGTAIHQVWRHKRTLDGADEMTSAPSGDVVTEMKLPVASKLTIPVQR